MKNHFTSDIRILTKSLKLLSLVDLMNTRLSIWNFVISIQYLNRRLDEERFSTHKNSGSTELFALQVLYITGVYISTQQIVERSTYLALWIWFISIVTLCRPAVSIDLSHRISSNPVPATRCPFACYQ